VKTFTTKRRRKQLEFLAAIQDSAIDTSDIPELMAEQLRRAALGQTYRPIKKRVTMRLDADVIAWLKPDGRGYQTKANTLLQREMLRVLQQRKDPGRAQKAQTTIWCRRKLVAAPAEHVVESDGKVI
jgi:uncharacterized protein (DUF4415 family)